MIIWLFTAMLVAPGLTRSQPKNQQELDKLQENILNQMINERLFLFEARKDTLIKVTDEEIDQALDEQIARIASQFDSEEAFLDQIALEGMTLREYKKRLRPEIENQRLKQKLINSRLSQISISRQEVYDFYETFKDSLPDQPEAVKLAHILRCRFRHPGGQVFKRSQCLERRRSWIHIGGGCCAGIRAGRF